ncbi:MAG: AmmeMemoRadiSam system protein B [Bacteroidales bacterium]|nr:AmmeMemoRadiSam system protein B [Bacteroidales bacterium]
MESRVISLFILLMNFTVAQCHSGTHDYSPTQSNTSPVMESDTIINRRPAVAGTFYPGSRDELLQYLEKLFSANKAESKKGQIVALIAPHAGYIYSGEVAAAAYIQLQPGKPFDNVILIGSSHHTSFDGASVYNIGNYSTPLGLARVNIPLANKLLDENPAVFKSIPEAHINEHSLEVQVPFLQYLYGEKLQIIPIVLGTQRQSTIEKIAAALKPYFGGNNLFVISTDFSHYPDYQSACLVDKATADAILKNSPTAFMEALEKNEQKNIHNLATSICGWTSMLALLNITGNNPAFRYHAVKYMNSGDATYGDKQRVVGYHAMMVTSDENAEIPEHQQYQLAEQEKAKLLRIARVTIEEHLKTGKTSAINSSGLSPQLLAPAGAFVTLNKEGKLRGCIGRFGADMPLYKTVQEMAVSAAMHDRRFIPVTSDELNKIHIEISVLTPMRKITDIAEIEMGKHGIYIKKGSHSGTFLPQVALQTKWTREEFLGHCARDKAGIGWEGWKDAEIYVYEAYVFGE